ncbi:MAG: DNA polymerase III subunit delta [Chloroflexi bacterium]|nr:DNA polymerase III subunit delta [Chloroflexota bacterium]
MVYLLYGDDDYTLRRSVAETKAALGDPEMLALNTAMLDGRAVTFNELQSHCETIPFLAPARLIIVDGLFKRFAARRGRAAETAGDDDGDDAEDEPVAAAAAGGTGKEALDKGGWSGLSGVFSHLPPTSTVLLIEEGPPAKNNPLFRLLEKLVEVREFKKLRGPALQRWVQERVESTGVRITTGAVRLLVDLIGDDLWAMASELDKLSTYALGRQITEMDVQTLTVGAKEASVFSLVDAIMARNLTEASRLLHQLLDDGAAPPYLLFMIARQFRLVLQAKELLTAGERNFDIGKRIGVFSDFALRKTLDQARAAQRPALIAAYLRLLEADLALKTGRLEGDLAVELLLIDLCRRDDGGGRGGARTAARGPA